jgi:FtsZ-binding cell division protein ZapB
VKGLVSLLMMLIISAAVFVQTLEAQVSGSQPSSAQTVQISVEDLKTLRQIAAENVSLKAECEELKRQCEGWRNSANSWQKLAEAEKDRADRVQAGAITELEQANKNRDFALNVQREQIKADRDYIKSLERDKERLIKSRFKTAIISFGGGALTGGFAGFKLARLSI